MKVSPNKTVEIEVIELRGKIFREVVETFKAWNEPMKLRILGQRHGKRLRSLGCPSIDEFVSADPRLELLHVTTGGRVVLPREEFDSFAKETATATGLDLLTVRANLLKAFNVRTLW